MYLSNFINKFVKGVDRFHVTNFVKFLFIQCITNFFLNIENPIIDNNAKICFSSICHNRNIDDDHGIYQKKTKLVTKLM